MFLPKTIFFFTITCPTHVYSRVPTVPTHRPHLALACIRYTKERVRHAHMRGMSRDQLQPICWIRARSHDWTCSKPAC